MSQRITLWLTALLLTILGVIPTANFITTGRPLGWWPAAVRLWLIWGAIVVVVALLVARFLPKVVDAALAGYTRIVLKPSPRVFSAIIFATAALLALYFGWRLFDLQPIVGDEFAQRFQAHLLASGRLYAVPEPPREFFSTVQTLEMNGKWFSQFPIGGPFMLAIGELLRAPWIVNPVFCGIGAVALYRFIATIADELTARGTALLYASCPFIVFMGGSQMNHVPALAFTLIALAALARWHGAADAAQAWRPAAVIGASVGVAATIRPFDAGIVALAIGVLQIASIASRRWLTKSLVIQVVAGLIPVSLLLAANNATVGDPFAFAYDVLNGVEHRPGFHMTPLGFEHTPRRGVFNISAYLLKLDVGLLTWPVPAMLVVVLTLVLLKQEDRWDRLLLGVVWLLLIGYTTYWSLSSYLGPRFMYTAAPVFLYYTARLPGALRDRLANVTLQRAAVLLIPLWMVVAVAHPASPDGLIGWRQMESIYRARSTAESIHRTVTRAGLTNAVVFIREGWHARLAARLRSISMRPLIAEEVVKQADACAMQGALAFVEPHKDRDPVRAVSEVVRILREDVSGSPLPNLLPVDQVALVPGRRLSPECQGELERLESNGASIAELLPYQDFDRSGRMTGDIIYARDFGGRNELLRAKYGNRRWYVVYLQRRGNELAVSLVPHP